MSDLQGGADKLRQNSFYCYRFVYERIWLKFGHHIKKTIIFHIAVSIRPFLAQGSWKTDNNKPLHN